MNNQSNVIKDALGNSVFLEWTLIDPKSAQMREIIISTSDILAQTYTQAELEFARKYPENVPHEMFLKCLAPLFKDGVNNVDWHAAEQQLQAYLKHFFVTTDFAMFAVPGERQVFVIAKDVKTDEQLGVIQFIVNPNYAHGTVKAAFYAVAQDAQERGLEKLLMSSIFAIIPDVKRIFLHARITNENALKAYSSWGFTVFPGPLAHWTDMEYFADQVNVLQKLAESLI